MSVALVETSAGANKGGGPMLSNAVLGKYCLAEWSAELGADRHEVGPSSAASLMSMSVQLTLHTAACSRAFVDSTKTSLQ